MNSLFRLYSAIGFRADMVTELKTAKRCNWCRKRLRYDHNLAICSDCAKRLSEMLSR